MSMNMHIFLSQSPDLQLSSLPLQKIKIFLKQYSFLSKFFSESLLKQNHYLRFNSLSASAAPIQKLVN